LSRAVAPVAESRCWRFRHKEVHMVHARGITLVEFVIVTGLLCILMINMPLPDFSRGRRKSEIADLMLQIQNSIMMARSAAISENVMVTYCRSDDGASCRGSWNDGASCRGSWNDGSIIFTDFNANRLPDGNDRILLRLPAITADGTLRFNSFRNRQYLQMTPRGLTNFQNGNFTFCPGDGDASLAAQLILSFSGRTRLSRDDNGDGIVENSQGEDLDCS
jgi:type IV fimbrial biogenesis protein FimT